MFPSPLFAFAVYIITAEARRAQSFLGKKGKEFFLGLIITSKIITKLYSSAYFVPHISVFFLIFPCFSPCSYTLRTLRLWALYTITAEARRAQRVLGKRGKEFFLGFIITSKLLPAFVPHLRLSLFILVFLLIPILCELYAFGLYILSPPRRGGRKGF